MYGWMLLLLLTTVLLCMYARYWLDGEYPREDREGRGRCYVCMHAYVCVMVECVEEGEEDCVDIWGRR